MNDEDMQRWTAVHEASHAVAGLACGHELGPVSIRGRVEGDSVWGGVCASVLPPYDVDFSSLPVELPFVLWPAAFREQVESRVITLMAGDIGGDLFGFPAEGRRPDGIVDRVEARLPALSAVESECLDEAFAETSTVGRTDGEKVAAFANVVHLNDLASAATWTHYLAAQTKTLLLGYGERIERLADLLLAETSLSAATVRQVLE